MPTATKQLSAEEKSKIAKHAVFHVLARIRREPVLRGYLGAGTEAFNLLTAAGAALSDEDLERVMDYVVPGSHGLTHESVEEILQKL